MTANTDDDNIEIIGGDPSAMAEEDADGKSLTDLVEQPAKVMRIGTMIKQLLEEVRAAPLDDASRNRLREIHRTSIRELEDGLAPELREELERLTLPFTEDASRRTPNCASRRPSWSAGSRACSTASRPRCSPSRWRPVSSWSRCGRARCRPAWACRDRAGRAAPGPVSTCRSSVLRPAHRDPQRVGRVPDLRREDAVAEEGVPRQGRRRHRTQRVQRRRHRGAAGHHHVAGDRRPGRAGRPQRRGQVDAAAAAVGDLRADPRRRRP